jgi:hypothetical protein
MFNYPLLQHMLSMQVLPALERVDEFFMAWRTERTLTPRLGAFRLRAQ